MSKVITPEFETATRKLGEISDWFAEYKKTVRPADDHIRERITNIEDCLDVAAQNIAELVSIEFLEKIFYRPGLSGKVE